MLNSSFFDSDISYQGNYLERSYSSLSPSCHLIRAYPPYQGVCISNAAFARPKTQELFVSFLGELLRSYFYMWPLEKKIIFVLFNPNKNIIYLSVNVNMITFFCNLFLRYFLNQGGCLCDRHSRRNGP